jgi:ubiquinone/menaquinone biosynthesis C-methylase UbiE
MTLRDAPNFDLIARPYRWMEYLTFGSALQRCRTHFIPQLAACSSALVLGDGDGRFLSALLGANPSLHVDAVDSSRAMLHLLRRGARANVPNSDARLVTHQTNALTFTPNRTYDLVATHFFLDCLTGPEIETLCLRLAPSLQPQALWLVSDFRIPTGPMRWPARALVRSLYLAFRLLTGLQTSRLPEHDAVLARNGFHRVAQHRSLAGILTTEIWEYTPAMQLPPQRPRTPHIPDPVPDPEPASPSLPEPDPAVFHHEPGSPPPASPACTKPPGT